MVFTHIKSIFMGRTPQYVEPTGELYRDGKIFLEDAAICREEGSIVVSAKSERKAFQMDSLISFEFTESQSGEVTAAIRGKDSRWVFLFTANLPKSVLQFYGQVSDDIAAMNGCKVLYSNEHVEFLRYAHESGDYVPVDSNSTVRILRNSKSMFLQVSNLYKMHRKRDYISPDTEFYIDQSAKSFSWAKRDKGGQYAAFRLVFVSTPALLSFVSSYVNSTLGREGDLPAEDREYFEKMEIENYVPDDAGEPEISDWCEEESLEEEESSTSSACAERGHAPSGGRQVSGNNYGGQTKEKNKLLAVGKERFFVSRGSSIGVFKNSPDDVEFVTSIKEASVQGRAIIPKKMLVNPQGTSLMIAEENNAESLHCLDLESGKIAKTWETGRKMNDFFSSSKSPDGNPTGNEFIGISDSSIFKIDSRSSGVVEGKTYASTTKFISGDSTKDGEFAVGSAKGEIRMYDKIDKRAKTLLPGLGDPILGVFVSPSGKYMICTCKSYLMLVTTSVGEKSGFHKSLGKDKPVPKRLHIRPEHLCYFGGEVNFTQASISTDPEERSIVVSTGPYVITWNLHRALKGDIFGYQIKENEQAVVANSFVPGNSDQIVVALGDDVRLVDQKKLQSPGVLRKARRHQ